MIIRHAEKPEPGTSHGVTPAGHYDSRSLTVPGWVRAGALITLFACDARASPRGLPRPDRVYGAAFRHGHSKREIQTVGPLAARLGVEVDTRYRSGEEARLAEEIRDLPGTTLVCWHHNRIHAIAENLGAVTPDPPPRWPDDRFDVVWTFTGSATGWEFAQVPQLFLPGDLADPIAGSLSRTT
jgi:hypothetical protein